MSDSEAWEDADLIDITICQSNPNCLVYYTITVGDWIYEGDALDVNSALTMIQHNLQHNNPKNRRKAKLSVKTLSLLK